MPTQRTREAVAPHHLVRAFVMAATDQFDEGYFFRERLFASPDEARRAWPQCRRAVWAQTRRLDLPRAARVFDGLTRFGWQAVWSTWNAARFPLEDALAALAADRVAVTAFEHADPRAARDIADYLTLWRHDLDVLQAIAQQVAADPCSGVTARMGTAHTYGAASAQ